MPTTKKKSYPIEYENGFPVLYRDTEDSTTDPCPYCGNGHYHGKGDGHRVSHCPRPHTDNKGYVIKTRNKAQ
jgi:hypothetical protein